MADFCQECSIEIFGEDFRDLANLGNGELPPGHGWSTLCEGCGYVILVDNDGKRLESDRQAAMEQGLK